MSVSLRTNILQSTIYFVRVTVSRPKRLQTVARIEKNNRMTALVGLTISFLKVTGNRSIRHKPLGSGLAGLGG